MGRRTAYYGLWGNTTDDDTADFADFDANLVPAQDVSVETVVTSFYFNSIVFVMLMVSYECLRRLLPHVYSSRKRLSIFVQPDSHYRGFRDETKSSKTRLSDMKTESTALPSGFLDEPNEQHDDDDATIKFSRSHSQTNTGDVNDNLSTTSPLPPLADLMFRRDQRSSSNTELPDDQPLDWIQPVVGVPWTKIRRISGMDGYFFLRYIRMCIRITAVSSFWFFLILVPTYMTGSNNAKGWYHLSVSNVNAESWRMWMPVVFAYLFSAFVFFVIKQEYRHFLELRQDFLARGSEHVLPQNRYSLMVENIPYELRSDRALYEYFDKLFPGKVHSARVVLKVSELEETSRRCMRTCRRLEKSLAYLHATGQRPVHRAGQGRMTLLGVDMEPCNINPSRCCCSPETEPLMINVASRRGSIEAAAHKPPKGTKVDSISYYTMELAEYSRKLSQAQASVSAMAESGNRAIGAEGWFDKAMAGAETIAAQIMEDSLVENSLVAPADSYHSDFDHVEHMTSKYGSIGPVTDKSRNLLPDDALVGSESEGGSAIPRTKSTVQAPFSREKYASTIRKWAGRLGLDFLVAGLRIANKQLDITVESVVGSTMSSTGFVTFLDLSSTTCAASAPLTVKAGALTSTVAPEPREINWQNAHIAKTTITQREHFVNIVLFLGVILWSFPLAAIQAFAKAEYLAQLPGMDWILTFHGGTFTSFINGYLPVVALLGLIVLLPLIFQQIALRYERRKTFSDVQTSMLTRYFYYQLANVYVSVTAGSILKSLADIIDHPSNILSLLGESLPTMVGYFVALLVTKIMAGLPMVFMRFGALFRMLALRLLARSEQKVTQRELDWVYRLENLQFGWEYPSQLLVVVIVFTYAIICPVILPVGLCYFFGALIVYKKQVLYVYSPVYESGGSMFPIAVQRMLFGLVCSELTLLGYTVTRGCYYQPAALLPLPIITVWVMRSFERTYATPSTHLSLERARHYDRSMHVQGSPRSVDEVEDRRKRFGQQKNLGEVLDEPSDRSELNIAERRRQFDKNSYRQPVLTEYPALPWMYRRGFDDNETIRVREQLRRINQSSMTFTEEDLREFPPSTATAQQYIAGVTNGL